MTSVKPRFSIRAFAALAGVLMSLAIVSIPVAAKDDGVWKVNGKLLGKDLKDDKKAKDVSGIACSFDKGFPRSCLVIDDDSQFAQAVTLNDGRIDVGKVIPLIDDKWKDEALELDGEGVAFAGSDFYVIGSHGHPRDKKNKLDPVKDAEEIAARIAAASKLIRLHVDKASGAIAPAGAADVAASSKLRTLIAADPTLSRYLDRRLDKNGLTIEGVVIRGDRLYVGFRGPSLPDDKAAVLSASLGHFFGDTPANAKLHLLTLGPGRGVRDLAINNQGFLVLAGPSAEAEGSYAVYRWDGVKDAVALETLPEVREDGELLKPEAILRLDADADTLRVLVMFDGAKEGGPRAFRIRLQ